MANISLVVIGILFLTTCLLCSGFILFHRGYVNKRLRGEGKKLHLPQPLTFCVVVILSISVIVNVIAIASVITVHRRYNDMREQLQLREVRVVSSQIVEGTEFGDYKDALLAEHLPGFRVIKLIDGDFECYAAFPTASLKQVTDNYMQYIIYVRYVGEQMEGVQMEHRDYANIDDYSSGTGAFSPETMYIGSGMGHSFYRGIKLIVKIAPETAETKENWDALPIYKQAYFEITWKH